MLHCKSSRHSKAASMELQNEQASSWESREQNVWNILAGDLQAIQAGRAKPLWTQYRGIAFWLHAQWDLPMTT